ncbi:MAG: GNAT family N-acetyltransferase [Planctomycetes bacterium]|nr:GNAT family N-acetyltransferase [Planctomycetota bacterium]
MPEIMFVELQGDTAMQDGSFDVVRQLRYLVLREPLGMPFESTLFDGDDLASTIHLVSYRVDESLPEPIGCLSLLIPKPSIGTTLSNEIELRAVPIHQPPVQRVQLRGMAVLPAYQGLGSSRSSIQDSEKNFSSEISATSLRTGFNKTKNTDNGKHGYNEFSPRTGVGGELLNYVHRMAKTHRWELWCNARESAVSFYAKYGWFVEGKPLDIPKIGPHYKMCWNDWAPSENTQ